jgi:hypothetical protein
MTARIAHRSAIFVGEAGKSTVGRRRACGDNGERSAQRGRAT